jgi:hypothetical protein
MLTGRPRRQPAWRRASVRRLALVTLVDAIEAEAGAWPADSPERSLIVDAAQLVRRAEGVARIREAA